MEKSSLKKDSRNIKVEILRIIACFAVIVYHIRELPWKSNGELSETAVFFECVCTICVMTFFLISGFFIYGKDGNIIDNWIKLLKKFFKTVFIPFLIITIICLIFHEYLISRKTFIECISSFNIVDALKTLLLSFKNFSADDLPGTAAHLWYIYSYLIIILVYPITRFIIVNFKRKYIYIILSILTIFMIINDYYLFYGNPSFNIVFKIIHKPIYYSLLGYILYVDVLKEIIDKSATSKGVIINKKLFFISIIVYLVTFILLFNTQVAYYLTTDGPYVYTSWLSTYAVVLTTAFIIFVYNLDIEKFLSDKVKNIIYFISSKTLGIYLIHYLIITKLLSIGFQARFTNNRPNIFYHLAYYLFYGLFIFIITFITVYVIDFIKYKLSSCVRLKEAKNG